MGVRQYGGRAARSWLAITPIALVAVGVLLAGAELAGTPAAMGLAATPAASTSTSSHFVYACGDTFTPGKENCLLIKNMAAHPNALSVRPGTIPGAGNGYGPSDLQSAYGLTSASTNDGAGTTVAVVDAFNDPSAVNDLTAYRAAAGLPALKSGQFNEYNEEGQSTPLPGPPPASAGGDWIGEESLDVDMVSAICPNCTIDLVEADDNSAANLFQSDLTAATTLGVKYISDSWGGPESAGDTQLDSLVFSTPGVVYVAGAGETSGYAGGMVYPAASPNVVSVGGTTLNTASNTRGWTESAWYTPASGSTPAAGSGSGCSAYEPQPSWQASISIIAAACTKRVDNDVAADANPDTGVAVYDSPDAPTGGSPWFDAGGTSAATPIIAAVFALAGNNGNGAGKAAASIYAHTSDLNEVTASNNGTCTPPTTAAVLCTATGAANTYNGPTGWGTPNGITAFQSITTSGSGVTVSNPGNQTSIVNDPTTLQIHASDATAGQTLTFTATGLPAGLTINSAGQITGTPTTIGTSQVSVTATDTAGATGTTSFNWSIVLSSVSSPGATQSTSTSPSSTCSSSAAEDETTSGTSTTTTTSPSATSTTTTTPSPTTTATATSTSTTHVTSFVMAASDCSSSASSKPSESSASTGAAPTPSPVSSNLAVTG